METIEIETMPQIQFAYSYHANDYIKDYFAKNSCMEVAFISEGSHTISYNGGNIPSVREISSVRRVSSAHRTITNIIP